MLQNGHYLLLSFEVEEEAEIKTMITGGTMKDYVDATTDKYCVYRVQRNDQFIKVKVTKDEKIVERVYSLKNLKLL